MTDEAIGKTPMIRTIKCCQCINTIDVVVTDEQRASGFDALAKVLLDYVTIRNWGIRKNSMGERQFYCPECVKILAERKPKPFSKHPKCVACGNDKITIAYQDGRAVDSQFVDPYLLITCLKCNRVDSMQTKPARVSWLNLIKRH